MKEQSLIEMKNKVEALSRVMQQVINEITNLQSYKYLEMTIKCQRSKVFKDKVEVLLGFFFILQNKPS